jgi:hypothetical protein
MSSESTRARDRTERGHQLHDEGAANPRRRNLMRSVRMVAVCFGPSIVLDLLLAASVAATASDALPDPNRSSSARLLRRIATVGSLAPWVYLLALRPWHLRWGATSEETRMSMPGDELVPQPVWECTRAVSIRAPATEVWPWLVQMGQGRGGLYTYDWLENLAGLDIHSADRIIPELQHLEVGDSVGFSAEGEPTVAAIEPDRFLALHISNNFSWVFVLKKLDERRTTRLILRSRIDANPRQLFALAYSLVVELPHFIMERRMLLGIKERAERAHEDQGALGTV